MTKVSGSLLSGRNELIKFINIFNDLNLDYIHLDIMDNIFVPHSSFNEEEIELIIKNSKKKLDVHLMLKNPEEYLYLFSSDNTEFITIHYEILKSFDVINEIRKKGIKVGISIKPSTDADVLLSILKEIDLILIMSVEPGMGGQEFLKDSLNKVCQLRQEIDKQKLDIILSIDGGITLYNYIECINSGVDMLVVGSSLISAEDKTSYVNTIKNIDYKNIL